MPAAYLSEYPFEKIYKAAIHPVLPEYSRSRTEGCNVCFYHAKRSVNGPEDEEYDEQMMSKPEPFMVLPLKPLEGGDEHDRQDDKHDIT